MAPILRFKAARRAWSPTEEAEFLRASKILRSSGLPIVSETGNSDEGDPWVIFVREDTGDVIVHVAKIDGTVVASSVATGDVVRGASFREVINTIVRSQPLVLPTTSPHDRIHLHPMAVIVAYVATALAWSAEDHGQPSDRDWRLEPDGSLVIPSPSREAGSQSVVLRDALLSKAEIHRLGLEISTSSISTTLIVAAGAAAVAVAGKLIDHAELGSSAPSPITASTADYFLVEMGRHDAHAASGFAGISANDPVLSPSVALGLGDSYAIHDASSELHHKSEDVVPIADVVAWSATEQAGVQPIPALDPLYLSVFEQTQSWFNVSQRDQQLETGAPSKVSPEPIAPTSSSLFPPEIPQGQHQEAQLGKPGHSSMIFEASVHYPPPYHPFVSPETVAELLAVLDLVGDGNSAIIHETVTSSSVAGPSSASSPLTASTADNGSTLISYLSANHSSATGSDIAQPAVATSAASVPASDYGYKLVSEIFNFANDLSHELSKPRDSLETLLQLFPDQRLLQQTSRILIVDLPDLRADIFAFVNGLTMMSEVTASHWLPAENLRVQSELALSNGTSLKLIGVVDLHSLHVT